MVPLSELVNKFLRKRAARKRHARVSYGEAEVRKAWCHVAMAKGGGVRTNNASG